MASAAHRISNTSVSSQKNNTGALRLVQVEGLVVLKIIKHFEQSGGLVASTPISGFLLGFLENETLEITNCFAFPADEENCDASEKYQEDVLKKIKKINIDNMQVGYYHSSMYGNFLTHDMISNMYGYQSWVEESVALIYDHAKTINGSIGLKALRLKPKFLKNYQEGESFNEILRKSKINYEEVLEELPIKYRNSHLVQCFLSELGDKYPLERNEHTLKLGIGVGLEKTLRTLSEQVDRMSSESARHVSYYKAVMKQQQQRQQHQMRKEQDNIAREKRGEPPLPQEDLDKMFKLPNPPPRLENVLISSQVQMFCRDLHNATAQNFSKLFLADSLQSFGYDFDGKGDKK